MDTNKLYNLLSEIENEYKKNQIAAILNSLRKNYQPKWKNYNNNEKLKAIENLAKNKRIEELGLSYSKTLSIIGGSDYFGSGLSKKLEEIKSDNQYDILEFEKQLHTLLASRLFFFKKCLKTKSELERLNIGPVYQKEDKFELGIHIPTNSKFSELKELEKSFKNWNLLFKTLNELTNNDHSNPKISYVANGSIEFFIENSFEVAFAIGYIIERLVKVYMNIDKIRKHRKELEKLGIPKSESDSIKKQEKEIIKNGYEQTKDDLIEKYKENLDEGRINEINTALMTGIKFVARTIDSGIEVEIIPPQITQPKSKKADKKSNKSISERKNEERINIIKETNNLIKNISEAGSDILKLMGGEENDEDSEEENNNA